jgi:hypothetical protein
VLGPPGYGDLADLGVCKDDFDAGNVFRLTRGLGRLAAEVRPLPRVLPSALLGLLNRCKGRWPCVDRLLACRQKESYIDRLVVGSPSLKGHVFKSGLAISVSAPTPSIRGVSFPRSQASKGAIKYDVQQENKQRGRKGETKNEGNHDVRRLMIKNATRGSEIQARGQTAKRGQVQRNRRMAREGDGDK